MAGLFLYPKTKHHRTLPNKKYTTYRKYKGLLREEFGRRCVYCRLPDSMQGIASFGVDHYRPKSLFPELSAEYINLFYCCNACNRNKSDFWPATGQDIFIPNPVDHVMVSYLRYKYATVEASNKVGEFAIEILDLNDEGSIRYREDMLHMLDVIEKDLEELRLLERVANTRYDAGEISEDVRNSALALIFQKRYKSIQIHNRLHGLP